MTVPESPSSPKVSVIVITYNRAAFLKDCLKALFSQTYRDYEVIVVDGGSTDETKKVASLFPVRFILQDGRGISNAYNSGVKAAKGEILAFLDDDSVPEKTWLETLIGTYEGPHASNRLGGVGGSIISQTKGRGFLTPPPSMGIVSKVFWKIYGSIAYENKLGNAIGIVCKSGYLIGGFKKGSDTIRVDWAQTCNLSLRKDLVKKLMFDENYRGTAYNTEPDLCVRVGKLGYYLLYNPRASVVHQASPRRGGGYTTTDEAYYYKSYNDVYFFLKNQPKTLDHLIRFLMRHWMEALLYMSMYLKTREKKYLWGIWGKLEYTFFS